MKLVLESGCHGRVMRQKPAGSRRGYDVQGVGQGRGDAWGSMKEEGTAEIL